ncbi:MAG: hypothetical protein ACRBN8_11180 [Nannocystales bacterium]
MRTLLLALTVAVAACSASRPTAPAPIPPAPLNPVDGNPEPDVQEIRRWLQEFGLQLSDAPLPIVKVSEADALAELGETGDRMWPEVRVEQLRALMWILLGDVARNADTGLIRTGLRAGSSQNALAYYRPERIALIDKEAMDMSPRDFILTHEVVHAYQDQLLGGQLFERLANTATIDALSAQQLTVEGHATFVGTAAFMGSRGVTPDQLTPSLFDAGSGKIVAPGSSALYGRGAIAMLVAFERGGQRAIDELLLSPPVTSEQMLHPSKLGRDAPTPIASPQLPGHDPIWVGSIGEFTMQNMLAVKIPDRHQVILATTGWDGDAIARFELPQGPAVVWRTVWDRPEDAAQFVDAIHGIESISPSIALVVHGRGVDVAVMAPPATVEDSRALAKQLQPLHLGVSDGAASTRQAEQDYVTQASNAVRVIDGGAVWRDSETSIPIPPGWNLVAVHGVPVLRGPMVENFADNILVDVSPNLLGFTLEAVEVETLRLFEDVLQSQVLAHGPRALGGRKAWVVETLGHETGSSVVLHQIRAVFFTATHRVLVTATAKPERWTELAPVFESVLAGLEPTPR